MRVIEEQLFFFRKNEKFEKSVKLFVLETMVNLLERKICNKIGILFVELSVWKSYSFDTVLDAVSTAYRFMLENDSHAQPAIGMRAS